MNKAILALVILLGAFTVGTLSAESDNNYMQDIENRTEKDADDVNERVRHMWGDERDEETQEEPEQMQDPKPDSNN